MQAIYSITYNLYEQEISNNKESIEELLSNHLGELLVEESIEESTSTESARGLLNKGPIKKSIKESTGHLSLDKVIKYIKRVYLNNKVAQKIIASKVTGYKKILLDLIKQGFRIKLRDYKVYKGMLYISKKLYIPYTGNIRIKIL